MSAPITLEQRLARPPTRLDRLELAVSKLPQQLDVEDMTQHHFSDGQYVRQMFIPANTVLTGRRHKCRHLSGVMSGHIRVVTEHDSGRVTEAELRGPVIFESAAGTRRAGFAITDTCFITIHPNPDNERDIPTLEALLFDPAYVRIDIDQRYAA